MEQITDDWDILQTYAREHSQQAFAALGAKYAGMVFNTALRRTGNRDLAEDVTQAVFIVLARRAGHLRPSGSLGAWLHKTTLNASANALRSESRRRKHERAGARPEAISDPTAGVDLAGAIDQALQRIGRSDREILCRHYLEERPIAEIAQRLGLSSEAARKRVTRALERLRGKLAGHQTIGLAAIAGALSAAGTSSSHVSAAAIASTAVAGGQNGSAFILAANVIRGIRLMTMAKAAAVVTVVTVVAVSAGAVTAALVHSTPPRPVATTQPAATQPTTLPADFLAGAKAAADDLQTLHAKISDSSNGRMTGLEVFYDARGKQPKVAEIRKIGTFQKAQIYDAGTKEMLTYAIGGKRVGVMPNAPDLAAQASSIVHWYNLPGLRRDPSADKTVDGDKWRAVLMDVAGTSETFWVDSAFRLRSAVGKTNEMKESVTGTFEWNVPIDPSRFTTPAGMESVNPREYLLAQYPVEGAVFKKEICGMTFCIHRMQRGDNGLIYLVTSTRLAPQFAKIPVGSWDYFGSCRINGTFVDDKHNIVGESCAVYRLAEMGQSGVQVDWWVLIPIGGLPVREFWVWTVAANQLAQALKPAGIPERQTVTVSTKLMNRTEMPLSQFVADAYKTTLELGPILHYTNVQIFRKDKAESGVLISTLPETISEREYVSQWEKNIRKQRILNEHRIQRLSK